MTKPAQIFALNICHILLDGLYDSIPVILAFVVVSMHADERYVGAVMAMAALCSNIAGLGTVYLGERLDVFKATGISIAVYGVGYILASFSSSLLLIGISFVVATLGHNIFHNLAFAYLTETTPKAKIGRAVSDFTALGDIGRIPLISLAGFSGAVTVMGVAGWRVVLLTYGVCAIVIFTASHLAFFKKRPQGRQASPVKKKSIPSFSLLRDKRVALAVLAGMVNTVSCGSLFTFLPLLLLAKGFDPALLGAFAFGFSAGCFIGKLACGRLIDRYGSRRTFILSHGVLAALLYMLTLSEAIIPIIAVSLAIGIVTKGSVPVIQTIVIETVEKEYYKDIFSISTFLRGIVLVVTPLIYGLLSKEFGIECIYILMAAASLTAILPILGMRFVNAPE